MLVAVDRSTNDYYYYYQRGPVPIVEPRRCGSSDATGTQRAYLPASRRRSPTRHRPAGDARRSWASRPMPDSGCTAAGGALPPAAARRSAPQRSSGSPGSRSRSSAVLRAHDRLLALAVVAYGWAAGSSALRHPVADAAHGAALRSAAAAGSVASICAGHHGDRAGAPVLRLVLPVRPTASTPTCTTRDGNRIAEAFRQLRFDVDPEAPVPGTGGMRIISGRGLGVHRREPDREVPRLRLARLPRVLPVVPGVRDRASRTQTITDTRC